MFKLYQGCFSKDNKITIIVICFILISPLHGSWESEKYIRCCCRRYL